MTEYKNLPENYPQFAKYFKRALPWAVLIFLSLVAYSYFTDGLMNAVVLLLLFAALFTFSHLRARKRQNQLFYSYTLVIDEIGLTRKQSNLADASISFRDITSVEQMNRGFLLVRGAAKDDKIAVWPYIENFDEVRSLLENYKPVTPMVYKNIFQKYPLLLSILMLGAFALVYLSNNKIVVGISGLVALVSIGWTFYRIRKSKQVDTSTKRFSWVILIFLLTMALTIYRKLIS